MRLARRKILASILLAVTLSSCGGGGGGSSGTDGPIIALPMRTLSWEPPTQYADNLAIVDPTRELKEYWIYMKSDNTAFTLTDTHVIVPAVDPITNQLVSSYDLRLAATVFSLKPGITYFVTMQAVSADDIQSDFSDPVIDVMF